MLDTVYHEITAEEFGRLASMKPEDRNEELYNRCPISRPCKFFRKL